MVRSDRTRRAGAGGSSAVLGALGVLAAVGLSAASGQDGAAGAAPSAGARGQPAASASAPASAPELWLDGGSPFFDPAKEPVRNWAMPFPHMDLSAAPYVDEAHLERSLERFDAYCAKARALGYTAIVLQDLMHVAVLDGVRVGGDGNGDGDGSGEGTSSAERAPIYAADSPYRARHLAYRAYYRRAAASAHRHGLRFIIETDFPAWTKDLADWLGEDGQRLESPRLWAVWRAAIAEAFDEVGADDICVRIGEGGGAYDLPELGYASTVAVRSVAEAHKAVEGLLGIVRLHNEQSGAARRLLFRTWTIGLGPIGALHTSPALYEEVFAPFYPPYPGSEHLVTVVKHVAMDFFEHVARNRTIGVGKLPQIVEVQARREYEGMGAIPLCRAEPYRRDLEVFRALPTFAGVSVWASKGGFLYPTQVFHGWHGPDAAIDVNVAAYAELLHHPERTAHEAVRAWTLARGAADRHDADRAAEIWLETWPLVADGLYLSAFARTPLSLFGLEAMPTMLWMWWGRPIAALPVQRLLYRRAAGELEASIAEGVRARARAFGLLEQARALAPTPLRDELAFGLAYAHSVLSVLARYREVFLYHHAFASTGDDAAKQRWQAAVPALAEAMREHVRAYGNDPFRPALDMRELDRELRDAARWPRWRWPAAVLGVLAMLVGAFALRAAWLAGRAGASAACTGRGALAQGVAAVALGGAGAATLLMGERLGWAQAIGAASVALVWGAGTVGVALARAGAGAGASAGAGGVRHPAWAAGLGPVAFALLPLGAALLGFAWRGPALFAAVLVEALLEPAVRMAMIVEGVVVVGVAFGLLARGAGGGVPLGMGRRLLAPAFAGVLLVVVAGATTRVVGPHAVPAINEALRIAPSIIGEAGTGVDELRHVQVSGAPADDGDAP